MKHNKHQYKPHIKWGDLYIRLNPSVDYLQGPPYFGSRREYQFFALISLVDEFYSDIEVEIKIRPDPLPHAASFLSLVCQSFQESGIHLTLAECFHLNRFVVSLSGEHWNLSKTLGGYGIQTPLQICDIENHHRGFLRRYNFKKNDNIFVN